MVGQHRHLVDDWSVVFEQKRGSIKAYDDSKLARLIERDIDGSDLPYSELDDSYGDFVGIVEIPKEWSDMSRSERAVPFSWRKLWAFMGPGFLMSIAYLDPGNIESDLQSGAVAKFQLLWVLLLATVMGLFIQTLSSKLGTVTGHNLAEHCYIHYGKYTRLIIWVMVEIALIASDMQEVIGTCIALNLLSGGWIPLWAGVLITGTDAFMLLFIDQFGIRFAESFFGFLLFVMAMTFGYEYVVAKPDQGELFFGMFVPHCYNCGVPQLMQAVGTIGAVVMPHNMYLHSALVRSRNVDRTKSDSIKEANFYYFIESSIALLLSFLINLFVVSVFAQTFYGVTNNELRDTCSDATNIPHAADAFPANDDAANVDLYYAGLMLGCTFGAAAYYIWAIGLLAAGQSSTMTGTYAGQFVMQGFLNIQWSRTKRVLFTRGITVLPCLFIVFYKDFASLSALNDSLNVLQSVQLPFAIIPVMQFISMREVMGVFTAGWKMQVICELVSGAVISVNYFIVYTYFQGVTISYLRGVIWIATGLYCLFTSYIGLTVIITQIYSHRTCKYKYLLALNDSTINRWK